MGTLHMRFEEATAVIGGRIDGLETIGALLFAQRQLAGLGHDTATEPFVLVMRSVNQAVSGSTSTK